MNVKLSVILVLTALSTGLSGCVMLREVTHKFNPQATVQAVKPPVAWQAPLPHGGELRNLNEFWQRYPHPVLVDLINKAQAHAPDVATALANMAEARENRVRAGADLLPTLDATVSATRSLDQPKNMQLKGGGNFGMLNNSITNTYKGSLQASWELDLYGSNRALRDATIAQETAAKASWHEARVSVAAEVATSYFNYMLCRKQSMLQQQVVTSSEKTEQLTAIAFRAGFKDAGDEALAISSLSDAKQQAHNQHAQCEIEIKNLTALTHDDEATIRQQLLSAEAHSPQLALDKLFVVEEIPANAIRQRPDIYRAEVDLIRAAADVKQAAADRLPSISLQGSIGWMRSENALFESKGRVWSLGPVQLTLPIFDGGTLKASQETREARYVESAAKYRGAVQTAIKETETALLNLADTAERQVETSKRLTQLNTHLSLAEVKQKAGFASQLEVEESRRTLLQAQKSALTLQLERANAWLNLYRAAGGGWNVDAPMPTQPEKVSSNLDARRADTQTTHTP